MNNKLLTLLALSNLALVAVTAQQKKTTVTKTIPSTNDSPVIPVTNAELGNFPYFRTLPNFYANDSATVEPNKAYFFDGKQFFSIEGKVSRQNLTIKNSDEKIVSEFGCIQAFDKVIATLGGIKIFTGKFPEDKLKVFAGEDMIALGSKSQIAPSGYYGIVEYVIKTPGKEVWVQLQPYSLASHFYSLLVVEKETPLLLLNTNKTNQVLADLEAKKKAIVHFSFEPDNGNLITESNDELLELVGIFQAHPDWKVRLECHNAPVGKPGYVLALTNSRAAAIQQKLIDLGVKSNALDAKGMGDQYPLVSNDTELGRLANTRIEISLQ